MRSADLVSSPKDDFTEQVYLPLSSDFTTGMMTVLIVCWCVMMVEGTSLPSLVQLNWTGFVPEANEQMRVASPPTVAFVTIIPPISGGKNACDGDNTAKINRKEWTISMTSMTQGNQSLKYRLP